MNNKLLSLGKSTAEFFQTLFEPDDIVHFRPIETWVELDKKKSRVLHKSQSWQTFRGMTTAEQWGGMLLLWKSLGDKTNAGISFGVCPRFEKQSYEKSWQIRTVRTLWADVDDVDEWQAAERLKKAGIPIPSVVVNSGSGVHLYWRLSTPYLIDDVGPPLPILMDWDRYKIDKEKLGFARHADHEFMEIDGERLYVGDRAKQNVPKLSDKALYMQDILSGIAGAIGGDHTHDLARLLRVPGTWNRKDARGGSAIALCTLRRCNASCQYSIDDFAKFADSSPSRQRRAKVALVKLPSPRKPSPKEHKALTKLLNACNAANIGERSEADFAAICRAVELGIEQSHMWKMCQDVSKFAERGEEYFLRTWGAAELHAKERVFDRASKENAERKKAKAKDDEAETPVVTVNPCAQSVGELLSRISEVMTTSGKCYNMAGQLAVIENTNDSELEKSAEVERYRIITRPEELIGFLPSICEFEYVGGDNEAGRTKPLTKEYASTYLNSRQMYQLPTIIMFSANPVFINWKLAKPGYDRDTGVYYAGPAIEPADSTSHLETLLADFCWE